MRRWLRSMIVLAGISTASGTLASPVVAQSPGRVVRGTVYDSLGFGPLAGAHVMLLSRSDSTQATRSVVADGDGRFEITGVASGVYLIGFDHPLLDSLGITAKPRQISLAPTGAPVVVDLAVPSAASVHDAFCPGRPATDSSSVLVGHLNDATNRGIISNGVVHASWIAISRSTHDVAVNPMGETAETGADGSFVLCDLPAGQPVVVVATAGADSSGQLSLEPPPARGVMRYELYLGHADAPHTGRILGYIKDMRTNDPLPGATVILNGTPVSATTGSDGQFTFDNLPYGTFTLSVARDGFTPRQQPVDVLVGEPASVTIALFSPRTQTQGLVRRK